MSSKLEKDIKSPTQYIIKGTILVPYDENNKIRLINSYDNFIREKK